MKHIWIKIPLYGCFVLLLAACSPVSVPALPDETRPQPAATLPIVETPTNPNVSPPTQEDETQTDPALPIPAVASLPTLIEKAKADLAQRLSIPASQISLIEAQEVFWSDASLGCPQPGIVYTQIQVPGYLIMLESDSNEFKYHANIHGYVFYCENPTPPMLETPGIIQP